MKPETLGWIEEQEPELVRAAEEYVKELEIHKADPASRGPRNRPRVSGSQLRNLLNAAQGRSSLAVLVNFLRYQIGRGRKGWEDERSGNALVKLLEDEVSTRVGKRVEKDSEVAGKDRYRLESRLAALLLGFVLREYTYRCREAGTASYV